MLRKIITIDEDKCNGCGLCVPSCAEGALRIVDGKARLVSEVYCDGLGACLGECPQGALAIEEREAPDFDEEAAKEAMATEAHTVEEGRASSPAHTTPGGCPGAAAMSFACPGSAMRSFAERARARETAGDAEGRPSSLTQWPVQLRLVPPFAPFLKGADILVTADCVPFALADYHERYLEGRVVLVGCPKLDDQGYFAEKLAEIFAEAKPRSITVMRMEVPCCGGLAAATVKARDRACPDLDVTVETVGIRGHVTSDTIEGQAASTRKG